MNKKLFIGIALIVVVVIAVVAFYLTTSLTSNPKIPLGVGDIAIQELSDYYDVQVSVYLPYNYTTLFNCHIEVKYLTQNDIWKTVSKDIGILNYRDYKEQPLQLDGDFKSGNPYLKQDGHYHGDVEPNIKVETYGYLKP